MYSEIIRTSCE